ncbi:MAG: hypothetical protein ACRC2O_07030, partial [Chitinophagaceae bacterium]
NSPYVDYISAPGTYYPEAVEMGDPYRSRSLINSVALHGKLWLDEMDQQTPLMPLKDSSFKTSLQKSIAQVRRNILFTFSKGQGLWFYDFGPSGFNGGKRLNDHGSFGWWDEPSLLQDIGKLKSLLEKQFSQPYSNDADILLVHSTETFYYTGSHRNSSYMGHWANNWVPLSIFRSGVVHDVIHADDLDKINPDQYKAIVFVNTWLLTTAQKQIIQSKIAKKGRHLIWLYAPGYTNGSGLQKEFTESLTAMKLKLLPQKTTTAVSINNEVVQNYSFSVWGNTVNPLFIVEDKDVTTLGTVSGTSHTAFARKDLKDYVSWFINLPPANTAFWEYIFKKSGAHIYNNSGDIFYSGGGILTVHSATGGDRTIQLKNGKIIQIVIGANSTTLLNPESGEVILK